MFGLQAHIEKDHEGDSGPEAGSARDRAYHCEGVRDANHEPRGASDLHEDPGIPDIGCDARHYSNGEAGYQSDAEHSAAAASAGFTTSRLL
ncbi:MAG: hypothetical protein WC809_04840 [Sinimarinibacterium sp.]